MTDDSQLAKALGRVASGLFILTARHKDQETGMLASWVMQAGFAPPMVTVAVRHERFLAEWLAAGAPFALNIISQGDKQLLKHFGRGFEPGEPAFAGLELQRTPEGLPLLSTALAYLDCTPEGFVDSGDHRVYLAQVRVGAMLNEGEPRVHLRANGLRY